MSKILEAQRAVGEANRVSKKKPVVDAARTALLEAQGYMPLEVPTIDGTNRVYYIKPIKRSDMFIYRHNLLTPLFGKLGEIASNSADLSAVSNSILSLFSGIDPELIWKAASAILEEAVIGDTVIGGLDSTDFFDDKFLELYIVVFYAIIANSPFFTQKGTDSAVGIKMKEERSHQ